MSVNPHNVDICVTCISDKPPQLPLREELPSLGIEVIYNAKGVGYEATEKETKKEREKIHKRKMKEMKKLSKIRDKEKSGRSIRSMLSPPGKSPLSSKVAKSDFRKLDPPEDFAIPKALSYGSYQRTLDIRVKNDAQSVSSSIETSSSMDEQSLRRRRKKKLARRFRGLFGKKKNPNDPPQSVEFPNSQGLEEAALQEAFNTFMSDEDMSIKKKPSRIKLKKAGGKNGIFPDLLPGSKDNPEQLEKDSDSKVGGNQIELPTDYSSSGMEQTTISSLGNESSIVKTNLIYDAQAFGKQARDCLSKLAVDPGISPVNAQDGVGGSGNIKVKLLGNDQDNQITEIYDLTEISENGNEDTHLLSPRRHDFPDIFPDDDPDDVVCHGSQAPISPYAMIPNDQSQYSEESSVPVPRMRDEVGRFVLDVSDVYEENGPGSPLVLSPVAQRGSTSFALSPASFAIPNYGQGKKKQNPYLPSFNPMRDDEFVQDGRDDIVVYRAESVSSSFRERNLSPMKLDIASPHRESVSRSYAARIDSSRGNHSLDMKVRNFDKAVGNYYNNARTNRPSQITPSLASKRVPALRKTVSPDTFDSLKQKVSFSEDIEERRYFKKEKYDYESSMADVKSSLSAIVNEGRDLTEPLSSALSREADEAFQAFTDQLVVQENPRTPQQILLDALSYGDPLPFDFEETIKLNPRIASQRLTDVDTYALHSACLRAFPKRFAKNQTCRVTDLVDDLRLHRRLIEALIVANPGTCRHVDVNGDLPVHIMARHLMEWEGQWYQKVYDKAKGQDDDQDNGSGITTLYQSMSECINVLLEPIIVDKSLCLQAGSVGRILPLHMAAIFTVPYNTLKSLLEAFPSAASIKCDLNDIKTFVPNHSTPLELHDRLSTDFPKWEIQRVSFSTDEEMTQAMLDQIYRTTNGIRRSDLMFAFSPKLLPYRKEAYRVRRMEKMIQEEMKDQDKRDKFVLTRTAEVFWVWLCEFQNEDDSSDNYAESVSRVIDILPFRSVRFLASVLNREGHPVIDRAVPSCADAIMERLDKISKTEIPVRAQRLSTSLNMPVRSSVLSQFDEDISERFRLHGQGFVGPLCRTIFNITETVYPSSFVLLPYKLVKDAEGRLGLESSQAAKVAMKFAEFLSDLTTPNNIIDTLDDKIYNTLGEDLVDDMNRASRESRSKRFSEFLELYANEPAYFYFIDDCTGVPIVDERNGVYPLIISEAAEMVEKVFPMMLAGMILMRGEKAISILVDVLLDDKIKLVLPHWIEAAKDLIGYTLTPNGYSTKPPLEGLLPLREKLINFVNYGPTENEAIREFQSGGLSNEWVVEISLVKMIIEMHDPRHYFCDLSQERATTQILWTHESDIVNDTLNRIDFKSPKTLKNMLYGNNESHSPNVLHTKDTYGDNPGYEERDSGYSSGEYTDSTSEDERPGMIITTTKMDNSEISKSDESSDRARDSDSSYSQREELESALQFNDDSFNLDSVVKLRVQLDEQEAKLHSLREKVSYIDTAGEELEQREENISSMIDEIANQKDILESPSKDGLEKAKALLLRICELEDRVLCREVEVGQLKNDVSFFQLEASDRTESRRFNDVSLSSSDHSAARSADETSDPREEEMQPRDDDIKSVESDHALNLNQVSGLIAEDDSTVGNSTMYNSSIEGYSTGYSAGMSRY